MMLKVKAFINQHINISKMKRVALYIILVLILATLVYKGCNKRIEILPDTFKAGLDSLHKVNDSLMASIQQKNNELDSLYIVDMDAAASIQELKGNIAATIVHTKAAKKVVKTLTDPGLVSQFNQRYPADTVSDKLQVARPVLVSAAEDLVELDGAKELIKIKDTIIGLDSSRLVVKDSVISKYQSKEISFKSIIGNQDTQIKGWQNQYNVLKVENTKLKVKSKFQRIASYIIIGGLGYLTLVK